MKNIAYRLLSAAALLLLPVAALADTVVNSTTIFRFSKDARMGFASKTMTPFTQFLGIDSDKLGDGNLSVHLYGWGRLDLADKSFNNDQADGSLTYGYLKYSFKHANAQVRGGRFSVNEGMINEMIDGLSIRTDLPLGFGFSTFGGANVHTAHIPGERTDGKGDGIFGGRLNYRYAGMLEMGLSGIYESTAPAISLNAYKRNDGSPIFPLTPDGSRAKITDHRLIGVDAWFSPVQMIEITGHTSYNTETAGVSEHAYLFNLKPFRDLVLTGEFNEYRGHDLFSSSVMFKSLINSLNDKSRTTGSSASYSLFKGVELATDYRHYTRDFGNADRVGGELRFTMQEKNTFRSGIGYHHLRAGSNFAVIPSATDSSASFHDLRGYAMFDTRSCFGSFDAIGYFFEKPINSVSSSWELSTSFGYHLTPALSLSGDLSYGKNPQFIDDLKGLIRLTYNINYSGKGGAK